MEKMANAANTSASTLEKCKALLQEIVTELNSSSSNSEASASTPAVTSKGSGLQLSASIHNEHRCLIGFHYRGGGRGRYNPLNRGGPRPLKASKAKQQPFPPSCAEYACL